MPPVVRFGSREPQVSRHRRTKLQDPAANGLVADAQTSRGQQILDVSVTQGEPQIEPNGVANNLGWETVAGVGNGAHHHSYPIHNATVTMPWFRVHAINAMGRRKGRIVEVEEVDTGERFYGSARRMKRLVDTLRVSSGEFGHVGAWTPGRTS